MKGNRFRSHGFSFGTPPARWISTTIHRLSAAFLAALLVSGPALASDLSCRVVAIADGDTFTCLTAEKQQVKVRMAEIDTPEKAQPYGTRSRQMLSELVFGKDVTLRVQTRDRYGRTVARAYAGPVDVNAEMIRQGGAWVYRDYLKDRSLLKLEEDARQAKRGLWALPEADRMPPWEWRKAARDQRQQSKATALPVQRVSLTSEAGAFNCSTRKTCGQMVSCAEAQFHLQQCGNGRLDADRDGVPCEALCR